LIEVEIVTPKMALLKRGEGRVWSYAELKAAAIEGRVACCDDAGREERVAEGS
jgi:hypothetical protein